MTGLCGSGMGAIISLIICALSMYLLYGTGHGLLLFVAGVALIVSVLTGVIMINIGYIQAARLTKYMREDLLRKGAEPEDVEERMLERAWGNPEWYLRRADRSSLNRTLVGRARPRELLTYPVATDIASIPDGVARANMFATLVGLVLVVYGLILKL